MTEEWSRQSARSHLLIWHNNSRPVVKEGEKVTLLRGGKKGFFNTRCRKCGFNFFALLCQRIQIHVETSRKRKAYYKRIDGRKRMDHMWNKVEVCAVDVVQTNKSKDLSWVLSWLRVWMASGKTLLLFLSVGLQGAEASASLTATERRVQGPLLSSWPWSSIACCGQTAGQEARCGLAPPNQSVSVRNSLNV